MISKEYKVPRVKISYILKKGQLTNSDLFIIRYIQNEEDYPRFRVIISKKLEPKAVKRNKLRRQLYETIRTNLNKEAKNNDYILIPKKKITRAKKESILTDLRDNIINTTHGNT